MEEIKSILLKNQRNHRRLLRLGCVGTFLASIALLFAAAAYQNTLINAEGIEQRIVVSNRNRHSIDSTNRAQDSINKEVCKKDSQTTIDNSAVRSLLEALQEKKSHDDRPTTSSRSR